MVKGSHHSIESIDKIRAHTSSSNSSITLKKIWANPKSRAKRTEALRVAHRDVPLSDRHRKSLSISLKGHKGYWLGKNESPTSGKKMSESTKRKIREKIMVQLSKVGVQKGLHETDILNEIEKTDNIKIDRHFTIIGYKPDGYCHKTNTSYEVNEYGHHKKTLKDLDRKHAIICELGCNWETIWDH